MEVSLSRADLLRKEVHSLVVVRRAEEASGL